MTSTPTATRARPGRSTGVVTGAAPETGRIRRPADERVNWPRSIPFFLVHLLCFAAIWTGISRTALILFAVMFAGRSLFVTAAYHRYFSHKTYKLNRFWQLAFAFQAQASAQKGVLWWASNHRHHHRYSDTERDIHSPRKGFWWSHVGWILADKHKATNLDAIKDFARYPELRFLNRHDWIAPWTYGLIAFLIGGWSGLVVGFFWSTVLLWHTTFLVNSAAHVFGRRRYETTDTSRNSLLIALVTGGEGWHNNHHHYQGSARQGFFWWEIDVTYYFLVALSWVGIVKDLKPVPARVLNPAREIDLTTDDPAPNPAS
jgi:stearoyl-CoA desaturase (delta-9 desaturase)